MKDVIEHEGRCYRVITTDEQWPDGSWKIALIDEETGKADPLLTFMHNPYPMHEIGKGLKKILDRFVHHTEEAREPGAVDCQCGKIEMLHEMYAVVDGVKHTRKLCGLFPDGGTKGEALCEIVHRPSPTFTTSGRLCECATCHRADERALIVKWIRKNVGIDDWSGPELADAIERGEHFRPWP